MPIERFSHCSSSNGEEGKCRPLLYRGNPLFLLHPLLDTINCVGGLNVNLNFLPSQSLDLNHSTSPKPQDQVKGWLLLDVIICKRSTIFQLFTSKNQSLLVRRNTFLVLYINKTIKPNCLIAPVEARRNVIQNSKYDYFFFKEKHNGIKLPYQIYGDHNSLQNFFCWESDSAWIKTYTRKQNNAMEEAKW